MTSHLLVRAIALCTLSLASGAPYAQAPRDSGEPASVNVTRVFPNLTFAKPVGAVQAPGHDDRWYVLEREGRVMTFATGEPSASTVFLDLRDALTTAGEEEAGLLGLAFHPQFATNRRFFVFYSGAPDSGYRIQSRISAFTAKDVTSADRSSEKVLIKANKAESNHNGGQLAFGPDGFLYASLGDGGGGDDPFNNGQSTATLFGKIIRIDVDRGSPYGIPADNPFAGKGLCSRVSSGFGTGDTFRSRSECPEIYAYGLRNAWRFSFDRGSATPDLWTGDVGQGAYEEINRIQSGGGNYGWDVKEGPGCHEPATGCASGADGGGAPAAGGAASAGAGAAAGALIDPIAAAPRATGLASIIGGYVYRGTALPTLVGRYLFTDFFTRGLYLYDASATNGYTTLLANVGVMASSFAQDVSGELYLVAYDSGGLYKIVPSGGGGAANLPR